jgi:hypothetical protein
MDFLLAEEQRQFRDVVHNFVAREVKPFAAEVDESGRVQLAGNAEDGAGRAVGAGGARGIWRR